MSSRLQPRLADLGLRRELGHVRLEVEDGRVVDRVEPAHGEHRGLDGQQLADAHAQPVRPALRPLCVNADLGPVRVVARPPSVALMRAGLDEVEQKDDLEVRELVQALQALRSDHLGIELDGRDDLAPVVINRLASRRANEANGLDLVDVRIGVHAGILAVCGRLGEPFTPC